MRNWEYRIKTPRIASPNHLLHEKFLGSGLLFLLKAFNIQLYINLFWFLSSLRLTFCFNLVTLYNNMFKSSGMHHPLLLVFISMLENKKEVVLFLGELDHQLVQHIIQIITAPIVLKALVSFFHFLQIKLFYIFCFLIGVVLSVYESHNI